MHKKEKNESLIKKIREKTSNYNASKKIFNVSLYIQTNSLSFEISIHCSFSRKQSNIYLYIYSESKLSEQEN